MNTNSLPRLSLLMSFVIVLGFGCDDSFELTISEPDEIIEEETTTEFYVRTYEPSIVGDVTTFSGEIVVKISDDDVEYGFMWYDPEDFNENQMLNIQEISVGTTSELTTYSTEIVGLPNDRELVVCSFIRTSEYDTYIGDEIPF